MTNWTIRRPGPGEGTRLRALRLQALADAPTAFGETYEYAEALPPADWEARIDRSMKPGRQLLLIAEAADGRWDAMMGAFVGEERDSDAIGLPHPPVAPSERWAMLYGV